MAKINVAASNPWSNFPNFFLGGRGVAVGDGAVPMVIFKYEWNENDFLINTILFSDLLKEKSFIKHTQNL